MGCCAGRGRRCIGSGVDGDEGVGRWPAVFGGGELTAAAVAQIFAVVVLAVGEGEIEPRLVVPGIEVGVLAGIDAT